MPDNPRWKRRPAGSTWGDWGPDDQLGRMNLLTPDKVLKGVAEVKEGKTFCLSPAARLSRRQRRSTRAAIRRELRANKRQGMPYMAYPLEPRGPAADRRDLRRHRRDDAAVLDAVGQPRACRAIVRRRRRRQARRSSSTTATAPASDIIGPMDYRGGRRGRSAASMSAR